MLPLMPNQRWSLDFVSDQLTDGRRFRVLTVVDDCTRECLALIADTSLSGARVARELATLLETRGKPITVVSDRRRSENDPGDRFPEEGDRVHLERDPGLCRRAQDRLALYRTGQADPRHAFIESFNGRLCDELLNEILFPSLHHARVTLAAWRTD